MAIIHFKCKGCGDEFNYDVGEVKFPLEEERPRFEKEIWCKRCGKRTLDEVELTEIGQTQLTELYLKDAGF